MIKNLDELGSPLRLNLYRTMTGSILFFIHFIIFRDLDEIFDITLLLAIALVLSVTFNVVIGDTLFFQSQKVIGVKIAYPIANLYPFLTVLLGVFFLQESISLFFLIGSIFIVFGVSILSSNATETHVDEKYNQRDKIKALIFVGIAAVSYALGILLTTIGSSDLNPIVANIVRMPSGAGLLMVMVLVSNDQRKSEGRELTERSSKNLWFQMILAGFLGTYISSLFLVLSAQNLGAGSTAVLTATGPLFAVPLAIIWLKEKADKYTIIGVMLTLVGLWVILLS